MTYDNLISIENIFQAWDEFKKGKLKKRDIQRFYRNLEDNLFDLHQRLQNKTYRHGTYQDFYVNDPKRRHIHKAQVSDRIVHHLLYKYLYGIFDKTFIYDSYSCRLNKGTHKAVKRLKQFTRRVSKNYSRECWAFKFDIKKFFASVDHKILLKLLKRKINDKDILWLLKEVTQSFKSGVLDGDRIPLGNLTSQIFANVYLNELDQFIRHKLKLKYYIRYADDFLILDSDLKKLSQCTSILASFLRDNLNLGLHSKKIIIRKYNQGIDFLGYIVLPHYILPRTKTRNRVFKKIENKIEDFKNGKIPQHSLNQSIEPYLGFLKHSNSHRLIQKIKVEIQFWKRDGSDAIL